MGRFYQDGARLIYHYDKEVIWIEPWGENSLRIRATETDGIQQNDWALEPPAETDTKITIENESAQLINGNIQAEISSSGQIIFRNQDGKSLLKEYHRNRMDPFSDNYSVLEIQAREYRPVSGGEYRLTLRFESEPSERLYGMGQYQQPYLNLKGSDLELAQRNSQASVPFVLSSLGYGFLWNHPGVGRAVFGKNVTTWEAFSARQFDYWITAGDTPAQIEEAYARATGTVPVMPEWAMGFWQSKLRYQTQEEVLDVAREYRRRGLPLSVMVIDFFHWKFQGDWEFDPEFWPDPEAMVRALREMGIEPVVSVWPTVEESSKNYVEMLEKGYLARTDRGYRIGLKCFGNTVPVDVTHPGARLFIWEKVKKNYMDIGIRSFWLDVAEPEFSAYDFDHYRYYEGSCLRVGNRYPALYAKAFFDGQVAAGEQAPLNLIRCAWAGSQKYGALVWSGDITSTFASMRNQLAAGLNMGIAGFPWWTSDIGGFLHGDPQKPEFQELLIRWFEWGAFCPVMRLHGDREPKQPPLGTTGGAACRSGAANEVWSFGDEAYGICRKYLFLRERLRPYIRKQMQAAHEKGTPVMRPLFYDFPQDADCWEIEDEYLFGPDILVAPVMEMGRRERQVYLPQGAEWINIWNGAAHPGGSRIYTDALLDQIPLFIKRRELLEVFQPLL